MKKAIRFTATWCGPCKMLAKTLESVTTETPIEVVDIDENSELAAKFMLQDDVETKRLVGIKPLKELEDWLND